MSQFDNLFAIVAQLDALNSDQAQKFAALTEALTTMAEQHENAEAQRAFEAECMIENTVNSRVLEIMMPVEPIKYEKKRAKQQESSETVAEAVMDTPKKKTKIMRSTDVRAPFELDSDDEEW